MYDILINNEKVGEAPTFEDAVSFKEDYEALYPDDNVTVEVNGVNLLANP